MPPSIPTSVAGAGVAENRQEMIERLVADQRQRWQAGETVLVESYLVQQADLQADRDIVLDLIYNEILLREQRGDKPSLEEYVRRFPHLEAELSIQFEVDEGLSAAPPSHSPDGQRATVTLTVQSDTVPDTKPGFVHIPGPEPRHLLGTGEAAPQHHFQGHQPVQALLPGQVNDSHAAMPQLLLDLVSGCPLAAPQYRARA